MYNDNTPMPFGKYKFTALCRLPAEYLLTFSTNKGAAVSEIREYVIKNIDKIKSRIGKSLNELPKLELACDKKIYVDKQSANFAINRISLIEQENKKPIRSYFCEDCNGWHTTSKTLEEFKNKQK